MTASGADAYPLTWPEGWPRTRSPSRSRFDVGSFAKARDQLIHEVKMLGGSYMVLSSNVALRQDGLPYANLAAPKDTGVAVYFLRNKRQMVFACDKWDRVADNMRAIQKTIEALRGMERWGASEMMERSLHAFEALPPPRTNHWSDVLGVSKTATKADVEAAYRKKAMTAHPDVGGSEAAMQALTAARNEALKALGAN